MGIAELITQAAADKGAIHGVADGCHAEWYVGGRTVAHEQIAVGCLRSSVSQIAGDRFAGGHWKGQLLYAFALAGVERKRAVAPVDRLQCQVGHFIATQAKVKQTACNGVVTQFDWASESALGKVVCRQSATFGSVAESVSVDSPSKARKRK